MLVLIQCYSVFFFFKQKTAYEMRISDWSSDVCSSDLRWDASLYDLLAAYGQVKLRSEPVVHMVARRPVVTLDAALHHLSRLIGVTLDWAELSAFLPADYDGPLRRSAVASSFLAALELARQGRVDLKQDGARSEEHTSELQSPMRISYAVVCLKKQSTPE